MERIRRDGKDDKLRKPLEGMERIRRYGKNAIDMERIRRYGKDKKIWKGC